MKIEVFGTGCAKCNKTYKNAKAAAEASDRADIEIVKVDKITDITARGVLVTPALAVDGDIKCSGKVPSPKEIEEWIGEK